MSPTVESVVNLGGSLFDKGLSYSALNTARRALSVVNTINEKPVGSHPMVISLLKGAFHLRPALPQTTVTWDPELVLTYLKKLSSVKLFL